MNSNHQTIIDMADVIIGQHAVITREQKTTNSWSRRYYEAVIERDTLSQALKESEAVREKQSKEFDTRINDAKTAYNTEHLYLIRAESDVDCLQRAIDAQSQEAKAAQRDNTTSDALREALKARNEEIEKLKKRIKEMAARNQNQSETIAALFTHCDNLELEVKP